MNLIRFVPNILSISRIPLSLINIHLFAQRRSIIIMIIMAIIFISDILDGAIARKFNCVTRLGKYLDKLGDNFAAVSVIYTLLLSSHWFFILPYAPLSIGLLFKSITYRNFDMIEFTWVDILNSFLAHFLLPCLAMASFILPEIQSLFPFLLLGSISVGIHCAKESYKEWKLGPFSNKPYFGRFLW